MNEEEKDKRIERLELVKKCLDAEINMLRNNLDEEKEKNKKLEEVIDMIASDYIQDYLYDERSDYPCEFFYDEIKKKDSCKQGKTGVCEECLKEYYFKVSKGEEYKNKYCGCED